MPVRPRRPQLLPGQPARRLVGLPPRLWLPPVHWRLLLLAPACITYLSVGHALLWKPAMFLVVGIAQSVHWRLLLLEPACSMCFSVGHAFRWC